MNHAQFVLAYFALAVAAPLALAQPQATPAVSDWIAKNAIRLTTVEAGHGFADMQPLKKIIGDARIVSLGEATHGTREFFQLKHRMLEFLATEMGFSIFSIEANMPEAYRLNDYVLNGKGDPKALLKGMYFWTWNTEEVLEMIQWMRKFNESGKGRVEFTGFDMQTPKVALEIVADYVHNADKDYTATLRLATEQANSASSAGAPGGGFGVATATFPLAAAVGKRVRYSGWIKTKDVSTGYAGLWWRVDGPGERNMLAFDNMQARGVTGTTDWKHFVIDLPVAANATNINFGALHPGNGTAWFDGLTVELDGVPYTDKTEFDLDFESSSPKGFYTGGNGYRVQLDREVVHDGKQSLRMDHVAAPPSQQATSQQVDPKVAVATWKDVVKHLEGTHGDKAAWAIQNARVVLQCMQMKANQVTRDASMAENVKWILDQSPKAKIVLWAHNGHVSTGGYRGYDPMGAALRKMYGDRMVVFGFAFNQGSFQAIQPGKGLMDHTVAPAPEGSLDAMLASTGIPILALDVRQAPKTGPVAEWLSQTHKTRTIGAMYSEDTAAGYMMDLPVQKSFDSLLFVEKTTAARKNTINAGQ